MLSWLVVVMVGVVVAMWSVWVWVVGVRAWVVASPVRRSMKLKHSAVSFFIWFSPTRVRDAGLL